MRRAFRPWTLSAGLAALALVAAGCGGSGTTGGSGGATGTLNTLVIANAVKVDTLDPAQNSVNESIWLDQNLYSRLLQPNSTESRPAVRAASRPGLCRSRCAL